MVGGSWEAGRDTSRRRARHVKPEVGKFLSDFNGGFLAPCKSSIGSAESSAAKCASHE